MTRVINGLGRLSTEENTHFHRKNPILSLQDRIERLMKKLKTDPSNIGALLQLSDFFVQEGRADRAQYFFAKAQDLIKNKKREELNKKAQHLLTQIEKEIQTTMEIHSWINFEAISDS